MINCGLRGVSDFVGITLYTDSYDKCYLFGFSISFNRVN